MSGDSATDSPLEAAAGAAGPRAIEAFSILGNDTRLSIMVALWEAFEPFAEDNAVSFSELRERLGNPDSGQFNYHLGKIEGHFVRKTDTGYELRRAGLRLVRTVISGVGLEKPSLELTEIDDECTLCGAPTAITYQDDMLYHVCTQCEGYFGSGGDRPDGLLSAGELEPAGLSRRRPEAILHAAAIMGNLTFTAALDGICDVCTGAVERSLHICSDHESEGLCDICGRRPAAIARFRCPICKIHHQAPPYLLVSQHPAVIAFYYNRGATFQYDVDDFESERHRRHQYKSHDQTIIAEDPPRIRVQIEYKGDELHLTMDEELNVVEVTEPE